MPIIIHTTQKPETKRQREAREEKAEAAARTNMFRSAAPIAKPEIGKPNFGIEAYKMLDELGATREKRETINENWNQYDGYPIMYANLAVDIGEEIPTPIEQIASYGTTLAGKALENADTNQMIKAGRFIFHGQYEGDPKDLFVENASESMAWAEVGRNLIDLATANSLPMIDGISTKEMLMMDAVSYALQLRGEL